MLPCVECNFVKRFSYVSSLILHHTWKTQNCMKLIINVEKIRNKPLAERHIYRARNTSFGFLLHKYLQRKQEAEWKLLAAILIIVNTEGSKCRWP